MSRFALNRQHVLAQILLRAWPFLHGNGRLTDELFSGLKFEHEFERVRTNCGFKMTINPSDLIGRHIYLTGEFDHTTCRVLQRFSRSGDLLLDMGANIGYVSCWFLYSVEGSRVVAVEPQPGVLDLLHLNLRQFGSWRYEIIEAAASDSDGIGHLQISAANRGASRLGAAQGNAVSVAMISAEHLLSDLPKFPDLVKIDVEGHEETVLSSLIPALGQHKPRAIVFEDHGKRAAPQNSIGSLMTSSGYDLYAVKKRLSRYDLVRVTSEEDCTANDYVALESMSSQQPQRRPRRW